MKPVRHERVASMIRQELARMLLFEMKDPRLEGVVLTGARVSQDLRIAWIRYQLHDASAEGQTVASHGLARATGFFRGCLKQRLAMRVIPELRFEFDDHAQAVERIDAILEDVGTGRGSDGEGQDGRGR